MYETIPKCVVDGAGIEFLERGRWWDEWQAAAACFFYAPGRLEPRHGDSLAASGPRGTRVSKPTMTRVAARCITARVAYTLGGAPESSGGGAANGTNERPRTTVAMATNTRVGRRDQ